MKKLTHRGQTFAGRSAEKGAALITSIFALLLITVLGMGLMAVGEVSRTISTNDRENTEALYMADSGIAHARKLIFAYTGNYDAILTANSTAPNTGDELSTNLFTSPITAESAGGHTFGSGSYVVRVTDDDDETSGSQVYTDDRNKRIIVRSIGTGRNGSTATVEAIISTSTGPAMLIGGNLNISGNPTLRGSGGSVHTNATLDLDGNPCADGTFSATGSVVDPDKARTGSGCGSTGTTLSSQPAITIPTYDIVTDFKALADYRMAIDGKVYNSAGTMIDNAALDGKWQMSGGGEWDWDSGGKRWTLGGDTMLNATYYSEGNITLSGNPGTSGSPKAVTLIAEGYIDISGNPNFVPALESYSVMAGTDLKIAGNAGSGTPNYQGIHYAGHQIDFSGNPGISGQVIAANLADTNSPGGVNFVQLQSGFMKVSGNPNITYDGGLLDGAQAVVAWREVRN